MSRFEHWTLVLTAANAFIVLVLAAITWWYAKSAKRQAESSDKQAEAASKQADFAKRTLEFFQKQTEEQSRIATLTLVGCVLELKDSASHWHNRMTGWAMTITETTVQLLPSEWAISLERAKDIPPPLYQQLQKLQKSSRAICRSIEQFSTIPANYQRQTQADEIMASLASLINDCITVFNQLGPSVGGDLLKGYVD